MTPISGRKNSTGSCTNTERRDCVFKDSQSCAIFIPHKWCCLSHTSRKGWFFLNPNISKCACVFFPAYWPNIFRGAPDLLGAKFTIKLLASDGKVLWSLEVSLENHFLFPLFSWKGRGFIFFFETRQCGALKTNTPFGANMASLYPPFTTVFLVWWCTWWYDDDVLTTFVSPATQRRATKTTRRQLPHRKGKAKARRARAAPGAWVPQPLVSVPFVCFITFDTLGNILNFFEVDEPHTNLKASAFHHFFLSNHHLMGSFVVGNRTEVFAVIPVTQRRGTASTKHLQRHPKGKARRARRARAQPPATGVFCFGHCVFFAIWVERIFRQSINIKRISINWCRIFLLSWCHIII